MRYGCQTIVSHIAIILLTTAKRGNTKPHADKGSRLSGIPGVLLSGKMILFLPRYIHRFSFQLYKTAGYAILPSFLDFFKLIKKYIFQYFLP